MGRKYHNQDTFWMVFFENKDKILSVVWGYVDNGGYVINKMNSLEAVIMTADTELFARLLLTLFSKEILDRVKEAEEPITKGDVNVIVKETLETMAELIKNQEPELK